MTPSQTWEYTHATRPKHTRAHSPSRLTFLMRFSAMDPHAQGPAQTRVSTCRRSSPQERPSGPRAPPRSAAQVARKRKRPIERLCQAAHAAAPRPMQIRPLSQTDLEAKNRNLAQHARPLGGGARAARVAAPYGKRVFPIPKRAFFRPTAPPRALGRAQRAGSKPNRENFRSMAARLGSRRKRSGSVRGSKAVNRETDWEVPPRCRRTPMRARVRRAPSRRGVASANWRAAGAEPERRRAPHYTARTAMSDALKAASKGKVRALAAALATGR
jgi:hypothetical protein